jgi:uncharacterized membrane protein YidH (DUF202 family)
MKQEASRERRAAALERTVLAWTRAAIAVAANGALLLHAGIVERLRIVEVAGGVVVLVGIALWVASLAGLPIQGSRALSSSSRRAAVVGLFSLTLALSLLDAATALFAR